VFQIKLLRLNGDQGEPLFKPLGTLQYERSFLRWVYLSRPGKAKLRLNKKETCEDQDSERSMDDVWHEASPES
jgi:hypothetical protein